MDGVADHAAVTESVDLAKTAGSRGHGLVNAVLRRTTREGEAVLGAPRRRNAGRGRAAALPPRLGRARCGGSSSGPTRGPRPDERRQRARRERRARQHATRRRLTTCCRSSRAPASRRHVTRTSPKRSSSDEPYDLHGSEAFARGALMPQSRGVDARRPRRASPAGREGARPVRGPGREDDPPRRLDGRRGRGRGGRVRAGERAGEMRAQRRAAGRGERGGGGGRRGARRRSARGYDRVLVDPPCSDLGTLQLPARRAVAQEPGAGRGARAHCRRRILDAGAGGGASGGRLVYSTCTISPMENDLQVEGFLAHATPKLTPQYGGEFVETLSRTATGRTASSLQSFERNG